MKSNYKAQLEIVRRLLQLHDPLGLMQLGAPTDEYDGEAEQVLVLHARCASVETLAQGIHQIFVASVGEETAGPAESYSTLAREIYEALHLSD